MAAVMMSFTSTCNRLDVEPWSVLARRADAACRRRRAEELDAALLPDRWKAEQRAKPAARRRHRLRRATRAKRHLPELAPSIVAPSQPTKELSLVPAVPLVGWWRVRAMTASRPDRHGVRRTDTLVINAGFGLTLGLGLFLIGVPYPLLWGILSATLRFVPYVGTWVAVGLILLFSVAVTPTWTLPLLVLAFVVVLELATVYVVEPLLIGHSTGVSPIALVVAAAFWAWLWGPIGLVLSTPLTACLVVLGRHVPRLEFLGVLLGAKSVMDPEFAYYQRLLARDQDEATDVVNAYLRTHPPETVYDEVLVPALVLAKRDRDSGELSPDDERFIFQVTRAILDDLEYAPPIPADSVEPTPEASAEPPGEKVLVLACPACDEADELALKMLCRLLDPDRYQTEVLSGQDGRAEGQLAALGEIPAVVCVGALPPGGLTQARFLCKRLRASFPDQKILVIRWGLPDNAGQRREELLAAGADLVAITLLEARGQVAPVVSVPAHVPDTEVAVT